MTKQMINHLRTEPATSRRGSRVPDAEIETLPESRGGQDLIGTRFPKVEFDRWIRRESRHSASRDREGADPIAQSDQAADGRPKATLYRWWTDTCPHCEASLPAIEQLRQEYEDHGLRVVAVYHPKPPRAVDDEAIAAAAGELGFHGAVALDQDWSILRRFYLSTGRREATSASFLVDADGVLRLVHPGPVFFPSDDPRFARENNDYQLIEEAVRRVLAIEEGERQ